MDNRKRQYAEEPRRKQRKRSRYASFERSQAESNRNNRSEESEGSQSVARAPRFESHEREFDVIPPWLFDHEHHDRRAYDYHNHDPTLARLYCTHFFAEVIKPSYSDANFILIARQGSYIEGTPAILKIDRHTIINNGQLDFADVKKTLFPGHVVEVFEHVPRDERILDRIPPREICQAKRITVRRNQPPARQALTMITHITVDKETVYYYYDDVEVKEMKLRKHLVQKLCGLLNVSELAKGTLFHIKYVCYGAGTRWIPSKDMYFTTAVETEFQNEPHEIVPSGGMVATIVDVSVSNLVQSHDISVKHDQLEEWKRIGELLKFACYQKQSASTRQRRHAIVKKSKSVKLYWDTFDDDQLLQLVVRRVFALSDFDRSDNFLDIICNNTSSDDEAAQSSALCYIRGGVVGVRKIIQNDMSRRPPLVMTLAEASFNSRDNSMKLICTATKDAVRASFGTTTIDELDTKTLTVEPFALNELAWPVIKALCKGDLDLLHPSRKYSANSMLFKACFGFVINSQTVTTPNNFVVSDSSLTDNQKDVVREILNPLTPVVRVEAPAGTGKTKTIASGIQELDKLKIANGDSTIPLLLSHSNSPLIQAARAVENYQNPPLVLASKIAAAHKRNEFTEEDARFTLFSHLQRLKDCPDLSDDDREIVNKACHAEEKMRNIVGFEVISEDAVHPMYDIGNGDPGGLMQLRRNNEFRQIFQDVLQGLSILFKKMPPVMVAATNAMAVHHDRVLKEYVVTILLDEATTTPMQDLAMVLYCYPNAKKLVLVGDSQQLGVYLRGVPWLLETTGYTPIFEKIHEERYGVCQMQLTTNFRFHPVLLRTIKILVYPNIDLVTKVTAEDHNLLEAVQPPNTILPLFFINAKGDDEWQFPLSCANAGHTDVAIRVLNEIIPILPDTATIAVLCLYNKQKEKLIKRAKNFDMFDRCLFTSVEGFMGHEADVVLVITTKTTHVDGNDFLNSEERMNTAITRAKSGLFVIGDAEALRPSVWNPLIDITRESNTFIDACDAQTNGVKIFPIFPSEDSPSECSSSCSESSSG